MDPYLDALVLVVYPASPGGAGWIASRFKLAEPPPQPYYIVTPCPSWGSTDDRAVAEDMARDSAKRDPEGRTYMVSLVTPVKSFTTTKRCASMTMKPGDKVRCIDAWQQDRLDLIKGHIYTVTDVDADGYVCIDQSPRAGPWLATRFQPVAQTPVLYGVFNVGHGTIVTPFDEWTPDLNAAIHAARSYAENFPHDTYAVATLTLNEPGFRVSQHIEEVPLCV